MKKENRSYSIYRSFLKWQSWLPVGRDGPERSRADCKRERPKGPVLKYSTLTAQGQQPAYYSREIWNFFPGMENWVKTQKSSGIFVLGRSGDQLRAFCTLGKCFTI